MINFISIIIPTYNNEKFISEAIQSVLKQTFKNFELIIVNNGSKDNTLKLIRELANLDKRIKILNLRKNIGMANALNKGINYCKADYVARMDGDDVMYKNRIEEQVKYINKHKNVVVLSCLGTYMDLKGNTFGVTPTEIINHKSSKNLIKNNKVIGILHPGAVFKKKVFQSIGGYRGKFWPAEDIDLWTRFALMGHNIHVQKKILLKYRIHDNSAIASNFFDSYRKLQWVKHCLISKNINKSEISYEEFLKFQKNRNIFIKINDLRKLYYKYFHRKIILNYFNNNFLKMIISIFITILLRPFKFMINLKKRLHKLL